MTEEIAATTPPAPGRALGGFADILQGKGRYTIIEHAVQ